MTESIRTRQGLLMSVCLPSTKDTVIIVIAWEYRWEGTFIHHNYCPRANVKSTTTDKLNDYVTVVPY